MGTISKPNTFSANTVISPSEVNDDFDTIYNEFNGGISASNLATDAVTTAKIAASNVTTAKIADDAVTAAKVDFGGAGTGIWWEEIGRTTLSSAGDTISVASLPARKYLMFLFFVSDTGGTISVGIRFNNDSTATYADRSSTSGAADVTAVSQTQLLTSGAANSVFHMVANILNVSTLPKELYGHQVRRGSSGAANAPTRIEYTGKWENTSSQISRIDIVNTAGTGDFAIGSELVVLGHD